MISTSTDWLESDLSSLEEEKEKGSIPMKEVHGTLNELLKTIEDSII